MRRLRESTIVTIMLLGLTGCAGVQQRLGWTEPPYLGDEGSDDGPLSKLAFWRRHRAEDTAPAASTSDLADPGRSPMVAANAVDSDDDGERPSLLRRLPLLGRLWRNSNPDESDVIDMPAARYAPVVMNSRAAAFAPPRSPAGDTPSAAPGSSTPANATASASPTANGTANAQPGVAAAGSSQPDGEPLHELSVDLAGTGPQFDPAAVPARNSVAPASAGSPAATPAEPLPPGPLVPEPGYQQQGSGASSLPSLPPPGEDVPPAAAPGPQPSIPAPSQPPTSTRGPSLPSPMVNGGSETGSTTSTVVSTPGPIWPITGTSSVSGTVWPVSGQTTLFGSGQSLVMTSPQGEYVSGGCDEPCGAKCNIHKLCPFKKHKQMVASSVVLPSSQGVVSSCAGTCKVKKPCFLKTWLHHKAGCKLKSCKGCKTCAYCGESPVMVSGQSVVVSPQSW